MSYITILDCSVHIGEGNFIHKRLFREVDSGRDRVGGARIKANEVCPRRYNTN